MSKTPVDTSVELNVSVASHFSKVPLIATEASTSNLTELSTGVIVKTGTPSLVEARLVGQNKMDIEIQSNVSRKVVWVQ